MEGKLPYETASIDEPIETGRVTIEGQKVEPKFGAFIVENFAAVAAAGEVTSRRDILTKYVSVFSSAAARAQLGSHLDLWSSVPIAAGSSVLLPAQGVGQITVRALALSDVCIVWHDDPIQIWG